LKAIEAGADHIDTAISSFASGTSHPATESQMETELLANIAGTVHAVYVVKGDRVTLGEVLIEIK